jgi:two-component system CheB/CheR fusion protein
MKKITSKKFTPKKSKKLVLDEPSLPTPKKVDEACSFPTVGIGASSGGLETFTHLLKELPTDTGMAFVLIQHLDPNHPSLLTEALSRATKMPVREITEGMKIDPNSVFVTPPAFDIGIAEGHFKLTPRDKSPRAHLSIDFFFRALAEDCGKRAIGIVLSGTANDGTEGLRAIKAANGVTFAQDPKSAKFHGMPQSAVNAEVVDFCLTVPKIAQELVRLARHPFIAGDLAEPLFQLSDEQELQRIFVLLRATTGVDYSEYKPPTIRRRLARRMALLKTDTLKDYIKYLQENPEEIKALGSDVLIHVTSFFRDPEVFQKLITTTFPEIIKHKSPGAAIRIWVTGCSSGEEVYSVAISLLEFLGENSSKYPIQLFGSDISERMIEKARTALYSDASLFDMDKSRLKRFFIKVDGGYKINKLVRDICVFVRHDLAKDPPFSKLDLVTCRNVLIYFEPVLQKRIIATFHYCLNQPGFMVLGRTESISTQQHLFATVDKTNKIFSREAVTSQLKFVTMQNTSTTKSFIQPVLVEAGHPIVDIGKQIDNLLLTKYSPAGVLINEQMEIIQYRGQTSNFLQPPPGQPQLNLFKMVREGLFTGLKVALGQAKKKMTIVQKDGLEFKHNGILKRCNLVVIPVTKLAGSKEALFLILFEEVAPLPKLSKSKTKALSKKGKAKEENASQRAGKLEHELRSTQEYLQTLNEEHQKTNDSLNSLNEEFVSGNEELQSMNEELETAKEELQSTNEELTTVNDELQNRNSETAQINDDMINLLNSAEIPIVILDLHRRIRRFTPKARKIMNLLPGDIGRQIDDIKPNIKIDNLDELIREVIDTVTTKELEVKDQDGKWQRIQIRPYKTIDNKIDGAVLSLINIDLLKRAVIDAEWVRDYSANIVEAVQTPLLVLDEKLEILSANEAFYDTFKSLKSDTEGKVLYEFNSNIWNMESLRHSLDDVVAKRNSFRNLKIVCECPKLGTIVLSFSARPIQAHQGTTMILLSVEDITARENRDKDKRELLDQAQKANLAKDLFLATLSHELRTPLTSLVLQAQMLQRGSLDEERVKKACRAIERAAKTQTQLIEDLLDVSRIVTGNLKMEFTPVDLREVINAAIETISAFAESKMIKLEANLDKSVGEVSGDSVRLQQVIWNLLTNAIKFTPHGGTVSINLNVVLGGAQIQVIDMGIGISSEFLPQVFNRFSQAEGTITRTHGGLGLGLAIVRHLIEMHDGNVKAESEGDGKGSTFTISLPLLNVSTEIAESDESKQIPLFQTSKKMQVSKLSGILNGMRILVVEDDMGVREALTEMLNLAGAEVREASCAFEAMNILKDFEPNQMVLDIAMPIENGYSLLNRIRRLVPTTRKIPALALTALASDKDREDAMSAGFQMHLVKPIDMNRLTGALLELRAPHGIIH